MAFEGLASGILSAIERAREPERDVVGETSAKVRAELAPYKAAEAQFVTTGEFAYDPERFDLAMRTKDPKFIKEAEALRQIKRAIEVEQDPAKRKDLRKQFRTVRRTFNQIVPGKTALRNIIKMNQEDELLELKKRPRPTGPGKDDTKDWAKIIKKASNDFSDMVEKDIDEQTYKGMRPEDLGNFKFAANALLSLLTADPTMRQNNPIYQEKMRQGYAAMKNSMSRLANTPTETLSRQISALATRNFNEAATSGGTADQALNSMMLVSSFPDFTEKDKGSDKLLQELTRGEAYKIFRESGITGQDIDPGKSEDTFIRAYANALGTYVKGKNPDFDKDVTKNLSTKLKAAASKYGVQLDPFFGFDKVKNKSGAISVIDDALRKNWTFNAYSPRGKWEKVVNDPSSVGFMYALALANNKRELSDGMGNQIVVQRYDRPSQTMYLADGRELDLSDPEIAKIISKQLMRYSSIGLSHSDALKQEKLKNKQEKLKKKEQREAYADPVTQDILSDF